MKPNEKLQPFINQEVLKQLEAIKIKNEENADAELWTPESISFIQYNTLQEFKLKNQVIIF